MFWVVYYDWFGGFIILFKNFHNTYLVEYFFNIIPFFTVFTTNIYMSIIDHVLLTESSKVSSLNFTEISQPLC